MDTRTGTFTTVHVATGQELHRVHCTMKEAKDTAMTDCAKLEDTVELRAVNDRLRRIERLAYYNWIDDIDENGSIYGYTQEVKNFHPYKDAELSMKGGRP